MQEPQNPNFVLRLMCLHTHTMSLWLTVARRSLVVISHRMDVVLLGSDAYYGEIGLLFRSEANNPNETMGRQLSEPHIGVLSKQDAQDSILYP